MQMKKTVFLNMIFFLIVMAILSAIGLYLFNWSRSSGTSDRQQTGSSQCSVDSDCVVYGKTGDCNCGCYNKNNLAKQGGGKCFCQTPTSCVCVDGECAGVFEREVLDEEVSQTECMGMSLEEAKEIAANSECGADFKTTFSCNEYTNTWWIDLNLEKEGCNPACVVNIKTRQAEINWRCTGLITE
jgi:hypothetical protein